MSRPVRILTVTLWLATASLAPAQFFSRQPPLPGPVIDTSNLSTPNPALNMQRPSSGFSFARFFSKLNPFKSSQPLLPKKPRTTLPKMDGQFKQQ